MLSLQEYGALEKFINNLKPKEKKDVIESTRGSVSLWEKRCTAVDLLVVGMCPLCHCSGRLTSTHYSCEFCPLYVVGDCCNQFESTYKKVINADYDARSSAIKAMLVRLVDIKNALERMEVCD